MTDGQTETQQSINAANAQHVDCEIEEYHARSEWSSTQLKCLREEGPLMFRRRYITGESPRQHKKAWDIGHVVHAALLEPTGLVGLVDTPPADVLAKNGARFGKKYEEWLAARPDKIILTARELAECQTMADRVLSDTTALAMLRGMGGHSEYSVLWHDAVSGLDLRCRFDRFVPMPDGGCILVDIKTARDVTPKGFARDAAKLGYHNQAALYWDGAVALGQAPSSWRFVAVQNCEPYDCVCYELSHEDIMFGRAQNRQTLNELARRLGQDDWDPDTRGRLVPLQMPEWLRNSEPLELTVGGEKVRV
jgi:hypothetical protein